MRVDEKTGSLRKLEARLVARGWMKAFPGWDRIVYMGCRDFYFERVQRELDRKSTRLNSSHWE